MSQIEPESPGLAENRMASAPEVAEIRREVGRENRTAWWVAGSVAVVAIMAVAFMVTRPAGPSDEQLTAAAQQGHAMGVVEGVQSTTDQSLAATQAAANAQIAAAQAQSASQSAADRAVIASQQAAAESQRSASAAADRASAAADRAADAGQAQIEAPPP